MYTIRMSRLPWFNRRVNTTTNLRFIATSPLHAKPSSKKSPSHYELLQVPRTATKDQIHTAYIEQAKLVHPDVNKNASPEGFLKIREAYKILHDEAQRIEYDLKLFGKITPAPSNIPRSRKPTDLDENEADMGTTEGINWEFDEQAKQAEIDELRKTIEDWENDEFGAESYFGRKRPKNRKGPREDLINTNLTAQDYSEWHTWSEGFISTKKKRHPVIYENEYGTLSDTEEVPYNEANHKNNFYADRINAMDDIISKQRNQLSTKARKERRIRKRKAYRDKAPSRHLNYDDF